MRKCETAVSRFSFAMPVDLHRGFKAKCASEGRLMADAMRHLLERECTACDAAKPANAHEPLDVLRRQREQATPASVCAAVKAR